MGSNGTSDFNWDLEYRHNVIQSNLYKYLHGCFSWKMRNHLDSKQQRIEVHGQSGEI